MRLPLAHPDDPIIEIDESIELDAADLLDIDGSDDQTVAGPRNLMRKLMAPKRNERAARAAFVPAAPPSERDDDRITMPFGLEKHIPRPSAAPVSSSTPNVGTSRMSNVGTSTAPAHFAFAAAPPRNPPRGPEEAPSSFAPVAYAAPAHFAARRERKASASFPPLTVMTAERAQALAPPERSSRAGWIAAAVIAGLLLIGGSMRVHANGEAAAAAAQPVDVAPPAAEPELQPVVAAPEPKVVHFAEEQAIAIKTPAKPAAPVKHFAAAKPTPKPASTLTLAESKAPAADKKEEKKATPKKPSISDELAEAQLRAAAR